MTVNTQELRELVEKAIQRAYYLGQEYWRLADSESWSDNRRSFDIQDKFDALRSETVSVAGAGVAALLDENDALRAELQARQWMPIETCPRDQEVLLGWYEWDGAWKTEVGAASWGWRTDRVSNISKHGRATHWQTLPPAPPQGESA